MPLSEGQVDRVAHPNTITFTPVTSCFTVTVTLQGGDVAGAHLSLMPSGDPGALPSDQIIPALVARIAGTPITRVDLGGYGDMWSPDYLITSKFTAAGDLNYDARQETALARGMTEMAVAILAALNFDDEDDADHVFYHHAT